MDFITNKVIRKLTWGNNESRNLSVETLKSSKKSHGGKNVSLETWKSCVYNNQDKEI